MHLIHSSMNNSQVIHIGIFFIFQVRKYIYIVYRSTYYRGFCLMSFQCFYGLLHFLCLFELKGNSIFLHFSSHKINHGRNISFQNIPDLCNIFHVFLFLHVSDTRPHTISDMIFQTYFILSTINS